MLLCEPWTKMQNARPDPVVRSCSSKMKLQALPALLTILALSATSCSSFSPSTRPKGANCSLVEPPPGAGEETGHGVFLQIYPRIGAMGSNYTGCQAVFTTTRDQPVKLAWLVEVDHGDPVRLWSEDASMSAMLNCRYRGGALVQGDPKVCETPLELMPSQPAGCAFGKIEGEACNYDVE